MLYVAEQGRRPSIFDLREHGEICYRFGYPDLTALLDPKDFEPLREVAINFWKHKFTK